jgi:putative FmdB family regulatory protein
VPIYEYECLSCRHRFEVKQKVTDPPVTQCVQCGEAVSKVISPPAIMFKGTGWYITDYSDKLKPKPESKEAEASSAGAQRNGDSANGTSAKSATASSTSSSASKPASAQAAT